MLQEKPLNTNHPGPILEFSCRFSFSIPKDNTLIIKKLIKPEPQTRYAEKQVKLAYYQRFNIRLVTSGKIFQFRRPGKRSVPDRPFLEGLLIATLKCHLVNILEIIISLQTILLETVTPENKYQTK